MAILNEQMDLHMRAVPSTVERSTLDAAAVLPSEYVTETARMKAMDVYKSCEKPFQKKHLRSPGLVVAASTVVSVGDELLTAPTSTDDARAMLAKLSAAGTHSVQTGVALFYGGADPDGADDGGEPYIHTFVEETKVQFAPLTSEEIEAYVATGEPMARPGAYALQGLGAAFVTGIEGDPQNVQGFPVHRFCKELDSTRLRNWLQSDPLLAAESQSNGADSAVDDSAALGKAASIECGSMDECGLPSD